MELKLNLYSDKFCRKFVREVSASGFDLSLGICEDLLDIINIDMFEGGLDALTDGKDMSVFLPIVKNALPFIKELLAELFEVSVEELKYVKLSEVVTVVKGIVAFAIGEMPKDSGKN